MRRGNPLLHGQKPPGPHGSRAPRPRPTQASKAQPVASKAQTLTHAPAGHRRHTGLPPSMRTPTINSPVHAQIELVLPIHAAIHLQRHVSTITFPLPTAIASHHSQIIACVHTAQHKASPQEISCQRTHAVRIGEARTRAHTRTCPESLRHLALARMSPSTPCGGPRP
jgi:hypothetical protein